MGRRKGQTYRKDKLKDIKRVNCPCWTLREDTLALIHQISQDLGVCQSYIVETALRKMLIHSALKQTNPAKIFINS
jgi:hypothetical protein